MPRIQQALSQIRNLEELDPITKNAKANLSFWGTRYITVDGYDGILPIDAFTKKILDMVVESPGRPPHIIRPADQNNFLFTRVDISRFVDQVYDQSDEQVRRASCFTKILVLIRSYRLGLGHRTPLRELWQDYYMGYAPLKEGISTNTLEDYNIKWYKLHQSEPADPSFFFQLVRDVRWRASFLGCANLF